VHLNHQPVGYTINLRSLLLLIAMLQGLVIATLLLLRGFRRKQPADFLLAGLLFFLTCSLISHFIGFMGVYDYAREHGWDLSYFPFDNPFTYGPLIWMYTRALTDEQFQWTRRDWLHCLAPLLYYLIHFSVWRLPDAVKFPLLEETFWGVLLQQGLDALVYPLTTWYLWLAFQRFTRYRKLIEQEYANTGQMTLDWLRIFLVAFAGYLVIDFVFNLVALQYSFWYTGWYWLNLIRAVLLYYISATGWVFAQKSSVQYEVLNQRTPTTVQTETAEPIAGKPVFSSEQLTQRRAQLLQWMDTKKPWLDPEITLSALAEQIDLNTSELSYLINSGFGQNFNDFINTYRVEEVKRKLASDDYEHWTSSP
jgi:AraC-like DNA-binding protein